MRWSFKKCTTKNTRFDKGALARYHLIFYAAFRSAGLHAVFYETPSSRSTGGLFCVSVHVLLAATQGDIVPRIAFRFVFQPYHEKVRGSSTAQGARDNFSVLCYNVCVMKKAKTQSKKPQKHSEVMIVLSIMVAAMAFAIIAVLWSQFA